MSVNNRRLANRNSVATENMAVFTPMPRPSDSSALSTKPGLRDRQRTAYSKSRQMFQKTEPPLIEGVFLNEGYVAEPDRIIVGRRHFTVKRQLGFEIFGKRSPAEEF